MSDALDLNLLRAFKAVGQLGSFSRAAEALAVPRSTVSRAVAALEASLDLVLFHRTTRKVELSTAGLELLDRVGPALEKLEGALHDLPERAEEPSGTLRLTTTTDLAVVFLSEVIARYTRRYPKVSVQAQLSNRMVDLAKEGVDLALRVSTGPLKDSALVAKKVGAIAIRLYAAPSYLLRRGTPKAPEDLLSHDWVSFASQGPLVLADGILSRRLYLEARVVGDDMGFVKAAIKAGAGIGALPSFTVADDLANGSLAPVLPRWDHGGGSVYLVHPGRKHLPRRVTAFLELATEMLRQRPLTEGAWT